MNTLRQCTQVALLIAMIAGLLPAKMGGTAAPKDPSVKGLGQEPQDSQVVSLMSFNIRYGTAKDGDNSWPLRRDLVLRVLRNASADFIGLQEALVFQIEEIEQALPGYGVVYRTRGTTPGDGEACAILYRKALWQLESSKTVWLSETPQTPGSKSWDSSLPRIATSALFSSQNEQQPAKIAVINTHFDHRGSEARLQSALMVWGLASEIPRATPVAVLGDFNAGEDSPPMRALSQENGHNTLIDTFRVVKPEAKDVGTFNSWQGETTGDKIDGIFVRRGTLVIEAEIVRYEDGGRYPSDHFPVTAVIGLPPK